MNGIEPLQDEGNKYLFFNYNLFIATVNDHFMLDLIKHN